MTSKTKRKLTEFLFLLPTLIAFLMVIIIPFIFGIYYSFTDWQGTGAATQTVGFANYAAIFQEPGFLHSFLVTLLFTVLNIITVNVVLSASKKSSFPSSSTIFLPKTAITAAIISAIPV